MGRRLDLGLGGRVAPAAQPVIHQFGLHQALQVHGRAPGLVLAQLARPHRPLQPAGDAAPGGLGPFLVEGATEAAAFALGHAHAADREHLGLEHQPQIGRRQPVQRRREILRLLERVDERERLGADLLQHHLGEQLLLRAEVVVEGGLRASEASRHFGHGGGVEAALPEGFRGRIDDGLAARLRLRPHVSSTNKLYGWVLFCLTGRRRHI